MSPDEVSFHDLSFSELEEMLRRDGVNAVHAGSLFRELQQRACLELQSAEHFAPPLRRWLLEGAGSKLRLDHPGVAASVSSADGRTEKYLLRLADDQRIETVLMGYPGRFTACVSTQAGCAMGCVFCATGQMGFVRNLRRGEIVSQVLHVQRRLALRGERLRNLVLMGMGEPLHNYDNVLGALDVVNDPRGANITASRITINTVGLVPGILRLAAEKRPYNLGVSLHAATDEERSPLVPVNRRWPLQELMDACRTYCGATRKRIFFSWTLIDGVNDTPAAARKLAHLLEGTDAHVNLIRLNRTAGYDGEEAPQASAVAFGAELRTAGIPCTLRQKRGIDVSAGCGQLTAEKTLLKTRRPMPGVPPPACSSETPDRRS